MAVDRVDLLRASATLTGIDFVEVSAAQTELTLFLQHDVLPAALAATLGSISPTAITITGEGQVVPAEVKVVENVSPLPAPVDGRAVMLIRVAEPGGFGRYRLKIDSPAIDPYFNDIPFTFKAACDSDLDCKPIDRECPPDERVDFPVDYRARDFWSFRQALIDFASQRYPNWQDRVEADVGMMLLELLAASGDEFAYANDRLVREATLERASQRRSQRHLARLVDYPLDDGAGATAWIDVTASAAGTILAGTPISDLQGQVVFEFGRGLRDRAAPPSTALPIDPARNQFQPHIWDEGDTCLFAGATTLALEGAQAALLQPDPLIDPKGRWVLLWTQPTDPERPERRIAVRLVEAVDDSDPLLGVPITRIRWDVPVSHDLDLETLVVRGNLLPATSGRTGHARFRIGEAIPGDPEPDLPEAIERVGVDSTICYPLPGSEADTESRVKYLYSLPGSDKTPLVWFADPDGTVRPELVVTGDGDGDWSWLPSLVGETSAEPNARVFTLEDGFYRRVVGFERLGKLTQLVDYASDDGQTIRFGDDLFGQAPPHGAKFTVAFRLGNGSRMNVAADTLVVLPGGSPFVAQITNPLAATGGRDPESAEQIRTNAPQAYQRIAYRAVKPADYAEVAERLSWVQKAGAVSRWTGSWPTIFVTADPLDEIGLSPAHRRELVQALDRVRQAGREVKVMAPRYADFDLEIRLCAAINAYPGEVAAAALAALFGSSHARGFFDPDNFTFGSPLSRAALIAVLQAVPGVRAVEGMRIRRPGYFDWRDFVELTLAVGANELVRVANDRDLPERGAVRLIMEGGA